METHHVGMSENEASPSENVNISNTQSFHKQNTICTRSSDSVPTSSAQLNKQLPQLSCTPSTQSSREMSAVTKPKSYNQPDKGSALVSAETENTIPKTVSPVRGRSRIARVNSRSEKRSNSARPYKRNTSSSGSKSRVSCADKENQVFPVIINRSVPVCEQSKQSVSVLPDTINRRGGKYDQSEHSPSSNACQNVGH